jgi:dynein heavy chain
MSQDEMNLKLDVENENNQDYMTSSILTSTNTSEKSVDDSVEVEKFILKWLTDKFRLLGAIEEKWESQEDAFKVVKDFVSKEGPKCLFVIKKATGYKFTCNNRYQNVKQLDGVCGYFIRPNCTLLTPSNISEEIQYGSTGKGFNLTSLEMLFKSLVETQINNNIELFSQYHKCMITLTDAIHLSDGMTVLYSPCVKLEKLSDGALDKNKVQILESIVIHWTRQIKEAVQSHDNTSLADDSGPLDEIEYWKTKVTNLYGIQKQLETENSQKIISDLEKTRSNYVGPLKTLALQITDRVSEASENLKFLETLREISLSFKTISPPKIMSLFSPYLDKLRLIWSYSTYYNTTDCVVNMIQKVSSEIIKRFKSYITLEEMLDGDVEKAISRFDEAIQCGFEWKKAFKKASTAIERQRDKYGKVWNIEESTVFAQLEAFIQRCTDLIDICESQIQFVRKSSATGNSAGPMPFFSGTKSSENSDGIKGIQLSFQRLIDTNIRNLGYSVLDVRVSKWHEDYNDFKGKVKDLEVMFTNVINAAFEDNQSVAEGVALVETFHKLARREAIIKCLQKKASALVQLFLKQLTKIRVEMETSRNCPPLRLHEPQFAGSALWAHGLFVIVDESYQSLLKIQNIITEKEYLEATEARNTFLSVIKDFKTSRYATWLSNLETKAQDDGLNQRFNKNLLCKVKDSKKSEIACNFDEDILAIFAEVNYWEKLHGEFTIPYFAHDLCNKRDQVRREREHVMQVVRAYNGIVQLINQEERRLFGDHLRKLNRHLNQGLQKLTWQSKQFIDMFVRDCCHACSELQTVIKEYQDCKLGIDSCCKSLSMVSLIRINKNQVFDSVHFEKNQKEFKELCMTRCETEFNKIVSYLRQIFRHFKDGTSEVQREWKSQLAQVFIIIMNL